MSSKSWSRDNIPQTRDNITWSRDNIPSHVTISHGHVTISPDHVTISPGHVKMSPSHVTISPSHLTWFTGDCYLLSCVIWQLNHPSNPAPRPCMTKLTRNKTPTSPTTNPTMCPTLWTGWIVYSDRCGVNDWSWLRQDWGGLIEHLTINKADNFNLMSSYSRSLEGGEKGERVL